MTFVGDRGETIHLPRRIRTQSRLWIVLTTESANGEVAIVNLLPLMRWADITTIVRESEHPYTGQYKCDLYVNYAGAMIVPKRALTDAWLKTNKYLADTPLTPELLKRVQDGVEKSPHCTLAVKRFCVDKL